MLSLGVVAVAALSLVSCQKENFKPNEPAVKGTPFSLTASIADTKTANDGLKTNWIDEDAINLFHAAAGTTTYSNDGQFTLADVSTGKFDGTLTGELTADSYDWYAFYPYTSQMPAPDGTKGCATLGHAASGSIAQNGNNSTLHLAGNALPLYGKATVAANEPVVLAMKNLASVVKVVVTNTTDEPLTVSSVKFTSTEDIVGTFYYNLTGADVVYKSSGANHTSSTASLTVENGETIAKGSSASFFIPVKPHTAATGATLIISVNGYEKPLTLPKDVEFIAGSINAIKFNYDEKKEPVVDYVTLPWSIDGKGGKNTWDSTPGLSQSGLGTDYKSSPYLTKMDTDGDYVQVKYDSPAKTVTFGANPNKSSNVFSGKINISGSIDGKEFIEIEIITLSDSGSDTYKTTKSINPEYRYIRLTYNKTTGNVGLGAVSISKDEEASTDPFIVASDIEVSARGTETAELTYEVKNPVEGTSVSITCDGTIVTEAEDVDGTIIYSVAKNTTDAAREGKITITYGEVVKEVKVSQKAPEFKVSREVVELNATADASTTITVTSDFDWMASTSDGAQFTFDPEIIVWDNSYTDGKTTVTITANAANESEEGTITLGTITFTNDIDKELIVTVKQKSSYVAPSTGETIVITGNFSSITDGLTLTYEGITITQLKGSSQTPPSTDYATATNLRIYDGNTLTFSSEKTITKIEFTHTSANNGGQATSSNIGTYSRSTTSSTWTGSAKEVVITNDKGLATKNTQLRPTKIVVTVE